MSIENILDDYITKEPAYPVIGYCENCSTLIESGQQYSEAKDKLFCDDECLGEYYEIEEQTIVIYCDECNEIVEESYIKDVYGNEFCGIDCLKKYYK